MRTYRLGAHTRVDLKVHVVWIPKYRKPLLVGAVAIRVRDLLRQIALEYELQIISGKVARDHIHLFLAYCPHQELSTIMQWLKGISSRILPQECAHLRKLCWGRHLWARGYLAVSSGTITDELVAQYIAEQEGEPVQDDSLAVFDFSLDSLTRHKVIPSTKLRLVRFSRQFQAPGSAFRVRDLRMSHGTWDLEQLFSLGPGTRNMEHGTWNLSFASRHCRGDIP